MIPPIRSLADRHKPKGKKIYSRRRLFEKIRRVTAFNAYMEKNPSSTTMQAWKELKTAWLSGGVKLTTKELRDYFATQVSAQVTDPNTVMKLLRHTSLNTTSRYTRTVMDRMKDAAQNLGRPLEASSGGNSGGKLERKSPQTALLLKLLKKLDRARVTKGSAESIKGNLAKTKRKSGGRSRT